MEDSRVSGLSVVSFSLPCLSFVGSADQHINRTTHQRSSVKLIEVIVDESCLKRETPKPFDPVQFQRALRGGVARLSIKKVCRDRRIKSELFQFFLAQVFKFRWFTASSRP